MGHASDAEPSSRCALCQRKRVLCDSHIIPEFMHRPGYDEKHRLRQIDAETGRRRWIQQGYSEPLLCERCEGFLNDNYEKPFQRAWYEEDLVPPLPDDAEVVRASGINYAPFKLFHLSVLWRASVASGGGFGDVDLGPHEDPMREMILNGDPGEPGEYPVTGIALTVEGELAHGFVMSPAMRKHGAMRIYTMIYGGFEWGIGVASHCPQDVRDLALTKDGQMMIPISRWAESPLVQQTWERHLSRRDVPDG